MGPRFHRQHLPETEHVLKHGCLRVEIGSLLGKVTDRHVCAQPRASGRRILTSEDYFDKGGFSRAVRADDAYSLLPSDQKRYFLKEHSLAVSLGEAVQD